MTHTKRSIAMSPVTAVAALLLVATLTAEAQQLEREQKQKLLDMHNSLRANVGASNMRQMVSVGVIAR